MKKTLLVISFIMLVLGIVVFIKSFKGDTEDSMLTKYHITNVSVGNYSIDVKRQKALLPVQDGLMEYYDIDLKKLEEYLKIISNVKDNINKHDCMDGHTLPYIKVKYDDGNEYSIIVWCERNVKVIDDYSYDDITKKFDDIFDKKSKRLEIVGTETELINQYGIVGIRLETRKLQGYMVAGGKQYETNDTTIIIGEQKVYQKAKINDDYQINDEKLKDFLNIIRKIKKDNGKVSNDFEGSYFIITYKDGHQIKIIDNKNNKKVIDNHKFNDLSNMFWDILK